MSFSIFIFNHYRDYLLACLGSKNQRKGVKSQLSRALACQPSLLSQVLKGTLDLSPEQGSAANRFFCHSDEESHYFLLLLLHARAGSNELRKYFEDQLIEVREKRQSLTKRLATPNELSQEQRSVYYSSWHYAALHIAVTIPALRSRDALAHFFNLPLAKVNTVIEFLELAGLVTRKNGILAPGLTDMFLKNESEMIIKHHTNWRLQAIESLDREGARDLHYSATFSLSLADAARLKGLLLTTLEEALKLIQSSPEEELCALSLDFFSLSRSPNNQEVTST